MSVAVLVPSRKRTNSFSVHNPDPRPSKAPRMGNLRRTESMLVLPHMHTTPATAPTNNALDPAAPLPYYRTLQYYKEQRLRRKAHQKQDNPISIRTVPLSPPATTPRAAATKPRIKAPDQVILPSISNPRTTLLTARTSSPLSPARHPLPARPVFPRSKAEPDLYKTAIKMRMLATPEGQRILHLGPRLALSVIETSKDILQVTRDLEKMVEDVEQRDIDSDNDVIMGDDTLDLPPVSTATPTTTTTPAPKSRCSAVAPPVLTTSWVVVKGDDWEMVECVA